MNGVDRSNDRGGAAWIFGLLGLGIGGPVAALLDRSWLWLSLGLLIAGAAGVLWQKTLRRDLADRLELLSWLLVIAAIVWGATSFIPDYPAKTNDLAGLLAFPGLVAGLVLTEKQLRKRD